MVSVTSWQLLFEEQQVRRQQGVLASGFPSPLIGWGLSLDPPFPAGLGMLLMVTVWRVPCALTRITLWC